MHIAFVLAMLGSDLNFAAFDERLTSVETRVAALETQIQGFSAPPTVSTSAESPFAYVGSSGPVQSFYGNGWTAAPAYPMTYQGTYQPAYYQASQPVYRSQRSGFFRGAGRRLFRGGASCSGSG